MNEQVKNDWVKALRSGDYKQCRGVLRDSLDKNAGFCCLGVLCDISPNAIGKWRKMLNTDSMVWFGNGPQSRYGNLPDSVRKWSGINSANGYINRISLAKNNDIGKTFNEIADIIEANWKEL